MKAIKKFIELLLIIVASVSLILCTGEAQDSSTQIIWSLGSLAVFGLSAFALDKMGCFKEVEK